MDIQSALQRITDGYDLDSNDMRMVMHDIMTGKCTPAQIAGFLIGMRMKGETTDEIMAAAEVMREL
ncbi:MAG: anthranilate phosphoribosyltransferase, partial [Gammaproteobacteria bacterium]|nr:anthranilate phosphoribosyltransferase [Gammaproteobacteria bacterium]